MNVEKIKCNLKLVIIILIIGISFMIRIYYLKNMSGDFMIFLNKWFVQLKENGGMFALRMNIGDYNAPYIQILALLTYFPVKTIFGRLYLIKIFSIIFDYIGAIASGFLVYELTKNRDLGIIGFLGVICLPTVILNSSAWAQCDFIYVAFIILSILFLLKDKYVLSFVFLGIAFSFKLQTIFVLPVFVLYYISERKYPIYYFLIIPVLNIIMCLPSILMGRSIFDILNIYVYQTGENSQFISLEFPGIYNLFFSGYNGILTVTNSIWYATGIIITGAVLLLFATYISINKIKLSKKLFLELCIWSVMLCTYFLPKMHDRYMFAADVLSVVCFLIDRKKWYLPIGVNISSLAMYVSLFSIIKSNIYMKTICIFLGIIFIIYTFDVFKELINSNNLMKNKKMLEMEKEVL